MKKLNCRQNMESVDGSNGSQYNPNNHGIIYSESKFYNPLQTDI